jgi:tetratricopeptide (TPR) repeat protein
MESLSEHEFVRALATVEEEGATPLERVEMLVEIAMGLQRTPRSVTQLRNSVALYDEALARCPPPEVLLAARIRARKATALAAVPEGIEDLDKARAELEAALPTLGAAGSAEEAAEAEMNLGLIIQSLAGARRAGAKIGDAIACYQRALRVFDRQSHPTEYAILHNNLATAYLSIPRAGPTCARRWRCSRSRRH